MSAPAAVQAAIDRALADVDALPDGSLAHLYPVLRRATEDVGRKLAEWLKDKRGADRYTAAMYRQTLLRLSAALERVEGRLSPGMAAALRVGREEGGVMVARHLASMVRANQTHLDIAPLPVPEAAVLARGRELLVTRHARSAARYGLDVARDVRLLLAQGMLQGETVDQLTRRLVNMGGPRGRVSLGPGVHEFIPEGLFQRYRYWAERLVRTEVMNAYNLQHVEAIRAADRADPGYLVRWDASRDRRTCVVCASLDDEVVDLRGEFSYGYRRPPAHPYCRCVVMAHRREWYATR